MRHCTILLLLCVVLAGCRGLETPPTAEGKTTPTSDSAPTAFPLTISDDLGVSMTFERPPQRIITLAPSLTEIAFALGLGDRVVGVTTFCKYPPEALKKEKVGGYVDASEEKIVSLAPDVIFATRGTPRAFMDSLRGTGLKVFALEQTTWDQAVGAIATMGKVCGVTDMGTQLAATLTDARQRVEQAVAKDPAPRPGALLIVSLDPLFVAGQGTFQSEMLTAAGANNVAQLAHPFGTLSLEKVVELDPQVLVMSNDENGTPMTRESQLRRLRANPVWRNVSAVKSGRVIVIDVNHLSVPGPRLALGLVELAKALHPQAFHD